jgi:transcriptional regulator with XRE-family HTH domain
MPTVDLHNVIGAANPLRRWRLHQHVTQAELALALGVTSSLISQWEKHRSVPTLEHFHRLYRHTGISVYVLLRFFAPLPTAPAQGSVVMQFPLKHCGRS